jgi:hypothetical protein
MTNEEMQKTMQFIVEQQAHFVANFHKVEESIRELKEVQTKAEGRISRMESAFVGLFNVVTETAKAQKELTEKVSELTDAQAQTDERLNIFITTVERFISEGRNGKSQS